MACPHCGYVPRQGDMGVHLCEQHGAARGQIGAAIALDQAAQATDLYEMQVRFYGSADDELRQRVARLKEDLSRKREECARLECSLTQVRHERDAARCALADSQTENARLRHGLRGKR